MGEVQMYYILRLTLLEAEVGGGDGCQILRLLMDKELDFVVNSITVNLKMAFHDKLLWWMNYIQSLYLANKAVLVQWECSSLKVWRVQETCPTS